MTNFKKPKRVTLSAQIVQQMERCIADGIWQVGEKIPSEAELLETFGVSRNTIRESVSSLTYAGILRSIPGDGTYVLSKNRMEAAFQARMKLARLSEILEARLVMETDLVRFAAERSTEEDIDALAQLALARSDPQLDNLEFIRQDLDFHLQIARQSHNELLYHLYESFLNAYNEELVSAYLNCPDAHRQHDEHNALYHAVAEGNGEKAAQIVRALLSCEQLMLSRLNTGDL